MKGPTDLARKAFAKMTDAPEGEDEESGAGMPKGKGMPDAGAVAGKRFGEAVASGDGSRIKTAFMDLLHECQGYEDETTEDEE